jgi:hypothetical protein
MGKLQRQHAGRLEQCREAAHEIVEVGDVREDVVSDQQVGTPFVGQPPRGVHAEQLDQRRDLVLDRHACDVDGGLDAQHGNLALAEPAQQIAVVAGDLHDPALGAEVEAVDRHLGIASRVVEPGGRERREVGVFPEDRLGRLVLLDLNEQAAIADHRA